MKVIGITGPIGTGKSYVTELISRRGIPSIDTDEVYHGLVSAPSPVTKALATEFGDEVLDANGALDRKKLGSIVFADPQKLQKLNAITHGAVIDEVERLIMVLAEQGRSVVIVQVPLMFESGYHRRCDEVICVAASDEVRLERVCRRDGITAEQARKRMANQKSMDFYIENSSKVVYNNGDDGLDDQIDRVLSEIGVENMNF